jgi:hypothetical protein
MAVKAAESIEELKDTLRQWQELEDQTIEQTTAIAFKSQNAFVKLVMEIIRHDSAMHRRVQQAMLDSLEKEAFSLTPEELADVWDMIEKHAEMEKATIVLAEKAKRNCRLFVLRHLLTYLIDDEQKHDRLLSQLEDFKRQLYPYA